MAKKNIARTAIEGGRTSSNTWRRRESNRDERAKARCIIASAQNDVEELADAVMTPREHVSKEFDDKLGPVYRWLDSHVGELWNDVRSKITAKFDGRTTAGRHILHDHILREVRLLGDLKDYYWYHVDENGLLQKSRKRGKYWLVGAVAEPREPISNRKKTLILRWLGQRRIGVRGDKVYWFEPTFSRSNIVVTWGEERNQWYRSQAYWIDKDNLYFWTKEKRPLYEVTSDPMVPMKAKGYEEYLSRYWGYSGYRQGKELSKKDMKFWLSIPAWLRTNILKHSPLNPPPKPKYYW